MRLFLAIPLMLLATALFFWAFLQVEWLVLAGLCIALVVLPMGWVAASVFSPAKPDRKCPECQKDALVPLSPGAEVGVRCTACNHVDEAASTAPLDAEEQNH